MKIASWNLNSVRVRLPQVLEWLEGERPDVLALQETKVVDRDFPEAEIRDAGYRVAYSGQKTYNGVALLSRDEPMDRVTDLPGLDDPQRRVLGASLGDLRILNVYVPNGSEVGSEKYAYKLAWLGKLRDYAEAQLASFESFALVGDFNIAPDDRDVYDPKAWRGRILCSDPERAALGAVLDAGLADAFRLFEQPEGEFSWWDYRMNAFKRNRGLRIDLILVSGPLARRCSSCRIDREPRALQRPSDHAPVVAEFSDA
jgi:exodeoxyribonuclease-3